MTDYRTEIQTASLLNELQAPHMLSAVEAEAYARRLRAEAIASSLVALGGLLKRGWAALAAEPAAPVQRQAYTLAQMEQDVRYQRAEAFAETIFQVTKLVDHLLAPVSRKLQAYFAREAAMAELYGLDDRTLYDMGLSRSEIPAAVAGNIYRPHAPKLDAATTDTAANENRGAKVQALARQVVA